MNKLLLLPLTIGLVAVPSLAMAQHETTTTQPKVALTSKPGSLSRPNIFETQQTANQQTTTTGQQGSTTPTNTATAPDETKPPITVPEGSLTAEQATLVAVGLYPDKTVKYVETELEHGVLVYEVKFTDGTEVTILASDGSVIENESHAPNANASPRATNKHNNGNHFGETERD